MKHNNAFEIVRTPELFKAVNNMSRFIEGLDLDADRNSELVQLATDLMKSAEKSGFVSGLEIGIKVKSLADSAPEE